MQINSKLPKSKSYNREEILGFLLVSSLECLKKSMKASMIEGLENKN